MAFTDVDNLKLHLTTSRVASFQAAFGKTLLEYIAAADDIIRNHARLQPPEKASDAPSSVRKCAAWLIDYMMLDCESGWTQDEYDRRKDRYEMAIAELDSMQGVAVTAEFAPVTIRTQNKTRLGDLP